MDKGTSVAIIEKKKKKINQSPNTEVQTVWVKILFLITDIIKKKKKKKFLKEKAKHLIWF